MRRDRFRWESEKGRRAAYLPDKRSEQLDGSTYCGTVMLNEYR
jgi:hypothetical protein